MVFQVGVNSLHKFNILASNIFLYFYYLFIIVICNLFLLTLKTLINLLFALIIHVFTFLYKSQSIFGLTNIG